MATRYLVRRTPPPAVGIVSIASPRRAAEPARQRLPAQYTWLHAPRDRVNRPVDVGAGPGDS